MIPGLLMVLLLSAGLVACRIWRRFIFQHRLPLRLLALLSILLSLACSELIAYCFYVESDGILFTLTNQLWMQRHWRPINSHYYRDYEWPKSSDTQKILLVVGDSLVAGKGLNNIDDRFANITARSLGPDWQPVTLAKIGWGTNSESTALNEFPLRADLTVLTYFPNDIEESLAACNATSPLEIRISPFLRTVLFNSVIADRLYWWWWRSNHSELNENYLNTLKRALNNQECLSHHLLQLDRLIATARSKSSQVIMLSIPDLIEPERLQTAVKTVLDHVKGKNIPVVDAYPLVMSLSYEQRTVSRLDSHPSKFLNQELTKLLVAHIVRQ